MADFGDAGFGGVKRLAGAAKGGPSGVRCRDLGAKVRVGIQHVAVAARVQQAPVIVLAMQFDQRIGQGAQHFGADAAVVDPCGFTPVAGVDTAQDQRVADG